jgi:hypothetical protein
MSLITRTYSFTDGTTAYGSQVESEVANIVNTINNLNSASTTWDIVKAVNGSSVPLIADNSSGSNNVIEARVNGVAKVYVSGTGVLNATNTIAMNSTKITGLAAATANGDAVRYEQFSPSRVLQVVQSTGTSSATTTSGTYAITSVTVTITPQKSDSKIKVSAYFAGGNNTNLQTTYYTIARDGTNLLSSSGLAQVQGNGVVAMPVALCYVDAPADTSSHTYAVYYKTTSASTGYSGLGGSYVMLAEEISQS